ncbi:PIR Superfamily Protein [Plasmodium ovale curtisi]|uniref:PIR Superfamily Protein n=1 Tax=Plasmodium ovale curtisi TaxID=864141 RepID=A0A1A8XEN2_PLAOA|nr:PIR Superfamily Protein [Plasmodium ovale curtisi]
MESMESKTIYNIVDSFRTYHNIIDSFRTEENTTFKEHCRDNNPEYISGFNGNFVEICELVIKYLDHLKKSGDTLKISRGCKYLYYWLYYTASNLERSSDNVLNYYENLLTLYVYFEGNIRGNYTKDIIQDIFRNVENLYNLYKYFYEFKNTYKSTDKECNKAEKCVHLYNDCIKECLYEKDWDYCDGLETFREHYNEYMKAVICPPNIIKILESYKRLDIATIILIPVIIILFTLFESTICTPLRSKNKYSNSINEETNKLIHLFQTTNKNSKRKKYNVAYHSDEYP